MKKIARKSYGVNKNHVIFYQILIFLVSSFLLTYNWQFIVCVLAREDGIKSFTSITVLLIAIKFHGLFTCCAIVKVGFYLTVL
jgi:hypothetical protein